MTKTLDELFLYLKFRDNIQRFRLKKTKNKRFLAILFLYILMITS
jgi:hypothetical protein